MLYRPAKLPVVCHTQLITHRTFPHLTPVSSTHLLADGEKKQWILLIKGVAAEFWVEQTAGCGDKSYPGGVSQRDKWRLAACTATFKVSCFSIKNHQAGINALGLTLRTMSCKASAICVL